MQSIEAVLGRVSDWVWGPPLLILLFGFGDVQAKVLLLCAALPTASNAYILAVRMTGDGRAVATQITIGTVISMLTIPLWLAVPI